MTLAQLQASDPAHSAWVSANAGTGKTKVLTDRVLRLLLTGVKAHKVLCITYTKAAAAEMKLRLSDILLKWLILPENRLIEELDKLLQRPPGEPELKRARTLFMTALNAPDGVVIETLHGFCQSLLRRFPVEAGVQPHFTVIEERTARELLDTATKQLIAQAAQTGNEALNTAIAYASTRMGEDSFSELVQTIIAERRNIVRYLSEFDDLQHYIHDLYGSLNIPYGADMDELVKCSFSYTDSEIKNFMDAIATLRSIPKNPNPATAKALTNWFGRKEFTSEQLEIYQTAFITKDGKKRDKLFNVDIERNHPQIAELLKREQERVFQAVQIPRAFETAYASEQMIVIAQHLFAHYDALKAMHAYLDFDDLILKAHELLHTPRIASWVLFKLDEGIDHILLDEAQDTSREQWGLISAITEEFFSGTGARQAERTLFVVGDEKQSIFSFQGAAPQAFEEMRQEFTARIAAVGKELRHIPLTLSFRSTREVLMLVDRVFAVESNRKGLGYANLISHEAFRAKIPGCVEFWPVIEKSVKKTVEPWHVPSSYSTSPLPQALLAERIASQIRQWLDKGHMLPGRDRSITPGDIMILVRKRSDIVEYLTRALKKRHIPVAGADRMALHDSIAIQDLLSLTGFLLLPEDNLSLAELLKSPLCGLNEAELFTLAHGRGENSLWERLKQLAPHNKRFSDVTELLSELLAKIDYLPPYEFYAYVLEVKGGRKAFASRLGVDVFDPLNEFLTQAMEYEALHPPSMQGFLHWFNGSIGSIKRDMEQGRDEVRIMTVHGSKGLQAPIVFLPTTTDAPTHKEVDTKLLWHSHQGKRLLIWKRSDAVSHRLRDEKMEEALEEYRRLLYVALTRAEDRLYIAGYAGKTEGSWYGMMQQSVEEIGVKCQRQFADEAEPCEIWTTDSQSAAETDETPIAKPTPTVTIPAYLFSPPPPEKELPRLTPSHLIPKNTPSMLPVNPSLKARGRGIIIHRLLELLFSVEEEKRAEIAREYIGRQGEEFAGEKETLVLEVLSVLAMPLFEHSESIAEVPIAGMISYEGKTVHFSAQIDRIFIKAGEVIALDYKTSREVPQKPEDIPLAHRRQLEVYSLLLRQIYPDKTIRYGLLYTAALTLHMLSDGGQRQVA